MTGTDDPLGGAFYDTLSTYEEELSCVESGTELHDVIFAPFYTQNFAGDVLTGPFTLRDPSGWGAGREFESNVVYLRSSPKGRIGKPLLHGEFRVISILLIDRESGRSSISVFRLFLAEGLIPPAPTEEIRSSFGPPGVPLIGLTIFERHLSTMAPNNSSPSVAASSTNNHLVVPSSVLVSEGPAHTRRIVAGAHDVPVARVLGGVRILDKIRHATETASLLAWADASRAHVVSFDHDLAEVGRGDRTSDLLFAARMICDGLSAAGLVDLLAADTSQGGLPDALYSPHQQQLFVAVACRIAAYPHRFDLWPSTPADRFAAEEVARAFEMSASPIVAVLEADEERHELFALDVVAKTVLSDLQKQFGAKRAKTKRKDLPAIVYEEELSSSIVKVLQRVGIGLCIDVCGPVTPELYTDFGVATAVLDPATVARSEAVMKKGACPQESAAGARRLTSRAERQAALFRLLHDVDLWLQSGVWKGQQISTPNDANPDVAWRSSRGTPTHTFFGSSTEDFSHRLCRDALLLAQGQLALYLTQGPAATGEVSGLVSVPFGRYSRIACSDCSRALTPSESYGFGFGVRAGCARCARRRCLECARAPDVPDRLNCTRCAVDRVPAR
jgi:hypothetical protein